MENHEQIYPLYGIVLTAISRHAGYAYSGPCAGHAYRQINPSSMYVPLYLTTPTNHTHFL